MAIAPLSLFSFWSKGVSRRSGIKPPFEIYFEGVLKGFRNNVWTNSLMLTPLNSFGVRWLRANYMVLINRSSKESWITGPSLLPELPLGTRNRVNSIQMLRFYINFNGSIS